MAYSFVWPAGLPQRVEKGYSEDLGLRVTSTPPDRGPAKIRRISSRPTKLICSFMMTTAQVATLETFIFDTIKGVARFGFPHPRLLTTAEVRIVPQGDGSYFTSTYVAPGYYKVSLVLEIMP